MTFFSSLHSICPRIKQEHGRLVARTGWRFLLPTLGLIWREVVVDPKREEVRVCRRYGWFFTRRLRIPFTDITSIAYDYQDLSPGRGWFWTHESYDKFTVRLRLQRCQDLHL